MGNVPTKLDQDGNPVETVNRPGYPTSGSMSSASGATSTTDQSPNRGTRTRRASPLVSTFLNSGNRYRSGSIQDPNAPGAASAYSSPHKRRSSKEKEAIKEQHARNILVRYDESVDGGFLAPYGSYGFDKLDYNADVVKSLIIQRRLAPFYTPLQDFDSSWSREELLKIVEGLPLHAAFNEHPEEFEDIPTGDLNKPNFDYLIDRNCTKKEYRRTHAKIFRARLHKKRIIWQETENEVFLEAKLDVRSGKVKNNYLPSEELKYDLYANGSECPICFLYIPGPLNYSTCCQQPICTECFVQIKRADPHFPHDEVDPTQPVKDDSEKDPNLLTTEPANCPYCATTEFTIIYTPPKDRKVGIQGIPPATYKSPVPQAGDDNQDKKSEDKPESKDINMSNAVSSDDIRPDWEAKLNKERQRLARRSANATAIHVSNQLVNPEYAVSGNQGSPTRRGSAQNSRATSNSGTRRSQRQGKSIEELENQMVQEAIRLSLKDEEQRKSSTDKK